MYVDVYINHKCTQKMFYNDQFKNGPTCGRSNATGSRGELQQISLDTQEGLSIHSKPRHMRNSWQGGISRLRETRPAEYNTCLHVFEDCLAERRLGLLGMAWGADDERCSFWTMEQNVCDTLISATGSEKKQSPESAAS